MQEGEDDNTIVVKKECGARKGWRNSKSSLNLYYIPLNQNREKQMIKKIVIWPSSIKITFITIAPVCSFGTSWLWLALNEPAPSTLFK